MNNAIPEKPRVLLAACGSIASVKFSNLCYCFTQWADVRAVLSNSSVAFFETNSLPHEVIVYTDEDDWESWTDEGDESGEGDEVLHIELKDWADVMVVAPLSANTLAKIAGGLCDNLLTCIIRAWDYSKPLYVAPSMHSWMWKNSFTENHLKEIDKLGIILIPPNNNTGAMAEPEHISFTVRDSRIGKHTFFLKSSTFSNTTEDNRS